MLDASPNNAPRSNTSPTTTSFWRLCQAPPARTWCGELECHNPLTVDELMDVVANYAAGDEAVDMC